MFTRVTLAWLLLAAAAPAQSPTVRITWIGQACFVVQNVEGSPTVVVDPPAASIGYALPTLAADVVTISHNHTDHNNAAGVRGNPTLADGRPVTARQEMTAAGMPFVLIPGFHDNQGGTARGPNTIIRWTQGGLNFVHMGDFGQDQFTDAQLTDLRDIDVLFFPAGGFFTIDAQKAAALVGQLKPRVAIPMHFRTALGGPAQLAAFPAAVSPFGEIQFKPSSVVVSRATLPASSEVWLLEVAAEAVAVNAAGFTAGVPVAPQSLVALFGSFTGSLTATAAGPPWPRKLQETEVLVGGNAAPLYYVSPTQINFQVPRQPVSQPLVEVRVGGQRVARAPLTVVDAAPGLFGAVNQDGQLNGSSRPALRGQVLQIFATGQGPLDQTLEDGAASPLPSLALTPSAPEVHIAGRPVEVQFSGMAPNLVGVWQINVLIPTDSPTGASVALLVNKPFRSNTLQVAIQ